jgi:murein DD-endopeptidase MepM/ murein hydrolase activator NlpD
VLFNKKVKYHIATDHKADIGTEVRSILGNGIVVYAKQNTSAYGSLSPDSPGGAVVIQYANKNGDPFYVLYGHITIDNAILAAYKSKSTIYIEKGQIVGTISSFYNAGELLPHLHFAISTSLDLKLILSGYVDDLSKVGDMVYPYDYLEEYCK